MQKTVVSIHGDEVVVFPGLEDSTVLDDDDAVGVLNGRETVSDDDRRSSLLITRLRKTTSAVGTLF